MSVEIDTIAALATPPGRGGVGIIRISGKLVVDIAQAVLGYLPQPRSADYRPFYDQSGETIDQGIVLYFPAPHSFTGEDVLELQAHGGPVVMDMLLQRVVELGSRVARPGEFSERAFLNDKLDLVQAEAIADLIESSSVQAARNALRSLQGEFSEKIKALVERLIHLRIYVESAIDFPEEEIDFLSDGKVASLLDEVISTLTSLTQSAKQGSLLREGMSVVIAGQPNAGKSSLLNRLARRDAAIVTSIPGTTRDVLKEQITIEGVPLHITDTAGLRKSDDPVELLGIARAREEIKKADCILLVMDDREDTLSQKEIIGMDCPENTPLIIVRNKIDLTGNKVGVDRGRHDTEIFLSAKKGDGIDLLCQHLLDVMGYQQNTEGMFMARRRHIDALRRTLECLQKGKEQLIEFKAGELLAEELLLAQRALNEITGEFTSDDLLGKIFSSFCIGK